MRVAVYAAPAPESELARLAAAWLGRDAFTGRSTRATDPERDPWVVEPARYGFHATLKAPFRVTESTDLDTVAARLAAFCAGRPAPLIRRLVLARLGAFLALVPQDIDPALAALEADVLRTFEPFRAPLSEAEIARRRPDRLTERQRGHLLRWGYPFVLDEFRFHMTVTGPVPEGAEHLERALGSHFATVLDRPRALDGLGLFVEPGPGEPFHVHAFHPFGPAAAPHPTTIP